MNSTNNASFENFNFVQEFEDFYRKDWTNNLIIFFVFLVNSISSLLMYSVIWYERFGADTKRILTNKLVSMICWNGIIGVQTIFLFDSVLFVFAPFSKFTCLFFQMIRFTIKSNFLTFLNAIAISKYIFIFWMKNPGSLEDDFWNLFLSLWTVGFSFILNLTRFFHPPPTFIFGNLCPNVNPADEKKIDYNKNIQVEVLLCLLIHITIYTRIQIFKICKVKRVEPTPQTIGSPNVYFQKVKTFTLADFVTNFILVLWMVLFSVFQYKLSYVAQNNESETYPNTLFLFVSLFCTNPISSIFISFVYFSRHQHLRIKIWNEIFQLLKM